MPGAGESPIAAKFYDLYRDPREEMPVSTEVGAWGSAEFVRIIAPPAKEAEIPKRRACQGNTL